MATRKFRIGQTVYYRPAARRRLDAQYGTYQITKFLPAREDGELEYRIRDLEAGHELAAKETELRPA
jgi:hypothetical protein